MGEPCKTASRAGDSPATAAGRVAKVGGGKKSRAKRPVVFAKLSGRNGLRKTAVFSAPGWAWVFLRSAPYQTEHERVVLPAFRRFDAADTLAGSFNSCIVGNKAPLTALRAPHRRTFDLTKSRRQ